jgi:translation initiation factor 2 subunit 1
MCPDFPEQDELVLCKVKRVQNYGAWVEVLEYNQEGYIHISQVASTWIKNIRNHIREGQMRVGRVIRIDRSKGVIDISLRKVSKDQEKTRIELWRHTKRAEALMGIAAKALKVKEPEFIDGVSRAIQKNYSDPFVAFEDALSKGVGAFEGVSDAWAKELLKVAIENVKIPIIEIRGTLNIQFTKPDGIEYIKKAFEKVDKDAEVRYISAPKYLIRVKGKEPKELNRKLSDNVERIKKLVTASGGSFEFTEEK